MSEEDPTVIKELISRELFRFYSVVRKLTQKWPSQQSLIVQQVHLYIEDIQSIARILDPPGTIVQSQHFSEDVQLESPSRNDVLSSCYDSLWLLNDPDDGDRDDNHRGQDTLERSHFQDLVLSASLAQHVPSLSRPTDLENLQELPRSANLLQNPLSADVHHIDTVTTINPAVISFSATNTGPSANTGRDRAWAPPLPTSPSRSESEVRSMIPASCGNESERHKDASRKASRQRQHKSNILPFPWKENELTDSISQALKKVDKDRFGSIALLYDSIGSESSLLQLKGILSMIRAPRTWTFNCNETDGRKIFQSLEELDATTHAYGLRRRILLLRFVEYRDRRLQELEQNRPASRKRLYGSPEPTLRRKVTSEVLDELVREICPKRLDEQQELFESDRKKVKNHLCLARHWRRATKCMGFGILALIPTGGPSSVQNTTFETLKNQECEVLLELLKIKDGGYLQLASKQLNPFVQAMYEGNDLPGRLKLEYVEDALLLKSINSSKFIELCEPVANASVGTTQCSEMPVH